MSFKWVKPPRAELIPGIEEYGKRARMAVLATAQMWGQSVQDDMRMTAPWEDRTGNARSGLFSAIDEAARDLVEIYLSHGHTIYYGLFLELAHGKRYAVIMPTIERNLPRLEGMLRGIFQG